MLRFLRLIDLEVLGAEKLKDGAGRLVVANHPSLLDVVLLMALVRRAQCVVKKELWESRYLGRLVRDAGYIPQRPRARCYADGLPEGTGGRATA